MTERARGKKDENLKCFLIIVDSSYRGCVRLRSTSRAEEIFQKINFINEKLCELLVRAEMANNFQLNQYYLYSNGNQTHFARVFGIFKHQICSARLISNVYFDFASHPLILGEKSLPFTHGDTLNLFVDILSSSLAKVKCCHCNLSELVSQYLMSSHPASLGRRVSAGD